MRHWQWADFARCFCYRSGPSQTYPQRAYRNPLDRLIAFLDVKHGDNWAIWEFRAEGTGYPDEAVYGRIRHYPWPDHHPPPFRLVPMIMASMRNWLSGEDDDLATRGRNEEPREQQQQETPKKEAESQKNQEKRVVVVHCKAGKGRSGTMTCSYLISQCGWTAGDALARFTERRMRPKFGAGVSIPSQLRWISYVDRWTKGGKIYVDQEVEILEVHVWGLRHGVKVGVEGFSDEGKKIKVFHTFDKKERYVVQGDAPGGGGVMDFLGDALSPADDDQEIEEDAEYNEIVEGSHEETNSKGDRSSSGSNSSSPSRTLSKKSSKKSSLARNNSVGKLKSGPRSKTINPADYASSSNTSSYSNLAPPNASQPSLSKSSTFADTSEPGGMAVIFKPAKPILLPSSDVKISLERRNRAPASIGLTMVTALAHVWFNTFFEGRGPEQHGKPDDSGVFELDWEKMDGLKGSSRKGTKAADRISVVWRAAGAKAQKPGVVITEPGEGSPVPQMKPADWKGADAEDPDQGRRLGLRAEEPGSAGVSKASSINSQEETGKNGADEGTDDESLKGVKSSLQVDGQEDHAAGGERGRSGALHYGDSLSEHDKKIEATKGRTDNPEEASGSAKSRNEHDKKVNATKNLMDGHQVVSGSAKPHEEIVKTSQPGAWGTSNESSAASGLSQSRGEQESPGSSVAPEKEEGRKDGNRTTSKRSGETTHLGFVERGKRLLPMHKKDEAEPVAGRERKDTRALTAHVPK